MDNTTALALPEEQQFRTAIQAINQFQKTVHANMVPGQDYGIIPGTDKPTLLKPGAEKIAKLLGLADQYEVMDRQEDWKVGFFRYFIKCRLVHVNTGVTISEGLGECNSMESKYRWRESKRKCPECGTESIIKGKKEYGGGWICFKKQGGCGAKFDDGDSSIEQQKVGRVENDDIYTQVNTILKMAKKRALVDAALSAGRLSNVFTQDIEDGVLEGTVVESRPVSTPTPAAPPKGTPPDPAKEIVRLKAQLREVLKANGLEGKSAADWVGQQSLEKYNEAPGNLTAEQWLGLVMEARKQFEPPQEAGDK